MQANNSVQRDIGSLGCTIVLIMLGALFYYDTTTMVDSDSYVFPRAIILIMIIISLIRVSLDVLTPTEEDRDNLSYNHIRGLMLVLVMGLSISLIPSIGFYLAIMLAFICIMYLSMYDSWQGPKRWMYPVIAVILVSFLYLLFENAFKVQFPVGALFSV